MEEKETASIEENAPAEVTPSGNRSGGCLRNLVYVSVIVFLGALSFVAITFAMGMNKTNNEIVEPVSNLVRQLTLPVTPVILPNPATIVREINDLARLETASFEFE